MRSNDGLQCSHGGHNEQNRNTDPLRVAGGRMTQWILDK